MPEASCTLGLCLSNTVFTTVPILAWGPSRDFTSWWALYSHYCLLCSSYKWLQEKWMPSCLSVSHYKTVGVNPTFQLENCGDQLEKDNEDLKMFSCSFFFIKAVAAWLTENRSNKADAALPPICPLYKIKSQLQWVSTEWWEILSSGVPADQLVCPAALSWVCCTCWQAACCSSHTMALFVPKTRGEKQPWVSSGGAKHLSLNPVKYLGLCVLTWFREQRFSFSVWTKIIEWSMKREVWEP